MSMTYYAVTNDPNELAHFGIKGMKWGVRHDKPRHTGSRRNRSPAYRKAQNKLSRMMKSGIKKAEANWRTYNSPKAKEERFMKKAMQKARTGTLKYGTLTDAQVRKVTERLALERNARALGSTENPRFGKRLKTAIGTGVVEGIGRGTASYINARFEGRGRTTAELKAQKRREKYESKESTMRRRAKKEAKQELYKELAEEGQLHSKAGTIARLGVLAVADPMNIAYKDNRARLTGSLTQRGRAKLLEAQRAENKERERKQRQQEARDRSYYTNYGKMQAEDDFKSTHISLPSSTSSPKAIVRKTSVPKPPSRSSSSSRSITPRKLSRRPGGRRN